MDFSTKWCNNYLYSTNSTDINTGYAVMIQDNY